MPYRKNRSTMISGHSKATLVGAFAIVFGVAQMICACMPASAMTAMDMAGPAAQHCEMPAADMAAMDMAEPGDPHDPDRDCPHCDGQVLFAVNMSAGSFAVLPDFPSGKLILAAPTDQSNPHSVMAPTAIAGLGWLDPPGQSPVTQKIRSLI